MNDAMEPVVFIVDTRPLEQGTKRANETVGDYRARSIRANEEIAASYRLPAEQLNKLDQQHRSFVARAASWLDPLSVSVRTLGRGIEDVGHGIEHVGVGVMHATKGILELGAATALAGKAWLAHETAGAAALDTLVNRARAARIAIAGWTEGVAGAAISATNVAAIVAIEKAMVATYDRAKQIEREAIASHRSGLGYENTVTLDFVARQAGVPSDFYNSAVKAAGGVDELGKKLKELAQIGDPVSRVDAAFATLGSDAEKYLPLLGSRFAENAERVERWGLILDATSREHVGTFRKDIDSLKDVFGGLSASMSAWADNVGVRVVDTFAGIYSGARNVASTLAGLASPRWVRGFFENDSQGPAAPAAPGADTALAGIYDRDAPVAMKYFSERAGDVQGRLTARISALEGQLFVQDKTSSDYGHLVGGANFPGGYGALAQRTQEYVSDQRQLEQIKAEADAKKALDGFTEALSSARKAISRRLAPPGAGEFLDYEEQFGALRKGTPADQVQYQRGIAQLRRNQVEADSQKQQDAAAKASADAVDSMERLARINDAMLKVTEESGAPGLGETRGLNREGEREGNKFDYSQYVKAIAAKLPGAPEGSLSSDEQEKLDKRILEYREKMIELANGPKGELATAREIYQLKIDGADGELERRKAAVDLMQKEAEIAAQLREHQLSTIADETKPLFHTLLTKPSQFGKQLTGTLRESLVRPVSDGLSRFTAQVLQPIFYGSDGSGGIGGIFGRTFGGAGAGDAFDTPSVPGTGGKGIIRGTSGGSQDPMKIALDFNSSVTVQNSASIAAMTAVLAAASGIAAPTVSSSVFGASSMSLPSISAAAPATGASYAFPGVSWGPMGSPGQYGVDDMIARAAIGGGLPSGAPAESWTGGDLPVSRSPFLLPDVAPYAGGAGSAASNLPLALMRAAVPRSSAAGGQSGSLLGGLKGLGSTFGGSTWSTMGGNLRSMFGGNRSTDPQTGDVYTNIGNTSYDTSTFGGSIAALSQGPGAGTPLAGAITSGGIALAEHGLLGNARGTTSGTLQGAAGGFLVAGPIGAAVGAGIGIGEQIAGVESPLNKVKRLAKTLYGLSLPNTEANQIVAIAQQKFLGNIDTTLRSPEVRQMLGLYAAGTGQKFPLSASTPHAASLVEQGGSLYQAATYQYGKAYTYQSGLPVAGSQSQGNWPGGPVNLSLNVGGQDVSSFMTGSVVTSGYVQDAYASSLAASNGRVGNSAMIQQPGLIVG